MAPGDVAHVPRTPSPVAEAGPVARHFRSRARLRRLLVRLRRPTPSTPALRATPGGASLTTFGFVTTVPRYLLEASNLLTFVRGACRAYCAPRKCHCDLIFVRRVSATAALFMRRARVMLTDRCFACTGCTHAPRRALAGALGSGTLPHALIVRHESGYGDRPSPACASRRATPKGVERAPGSGTLPPPCRRTYARTSEIPVFPPKTNCILQSPVYINNSVVTGRSPANSVNRKSSKSL